MQLIKNRLKGLGLMDSTIKTYLSILSHFFKHTKKALNHTEQDISDYLDYLMIVKNYSGRSRNLAMKIIKFYCREFEGKVTLNLIDNADRPLGVFIATDFQLIKSLRKNNLNKIELVFQEVKYG